MNKLHGKFSNRLKGRFNAECDAITMAFRPETQSLAREAILSAVRGESNEDSLERVEHFAKMIAVLKDGRRDFRE